MHDLLVVSINMKMASTFLRTVDAFFFHSRLRLHSEFARTMGSIISCGKKGSITIAGSQSELSKGGSMSTHSRDLDIVEETVCSESDIPDEGLKACELNGKKILLVKSQGVVHAVGANCTHYGLPLENGAFCKGRLRCPFHGACFNIETGDIEDFPGLDSIPKFDVSITEDGEVRVRANMSLLRESKRIKEMVKRDPENLLTFVVVGGGAAGAKCVETLRQEGFSGRVLLLAAEEALPYDRPKLSKAMHLGPEAIALRNSSFYGEVDIEVKLNTVVTEVNTAEKSVTTSSGEQLAFDKLFLATGGYARTLSVPGSDLKGVFVLRSFSDANAIAEEAKGKKIVIVGTSFIGMETAAYLSSEDRCQSVMVIGRDSVPFGRTLGHTVGQRVQSLFEERGVTFMNNAVVSQLEGEESVEKVIVNEDKEVVADIVVVGVGVDPATGFLAGSDVTLDSRGFVPVNEEMETNVEGIFCGGDIASFPLFLYSESPVTIGHWQMALKHGHIAALNMVGKKQTIRSVPFFWTFLYGKSLRYTGFGSFDDVIISGDLENLAFIAYYCQENKVVAVASLGRDPATANYANYLYNGSFLTKDEVIADGDIALHLPC